MPGGAGADGWVRFSCEWCGKPCLRSPDGQRHARPGVCVRCAEELRREAKLRPPDPAERRGHVRVAPEVGRRRELQHGADA